MFVLPGRRALFSVCLLLCSSLLAACGGGGDAPAPVVAQTPVAQDVTAHMFRNGGSVLCSLSAADPNGDPLAYLIFLHPLHGTLGAVSANTVVYSPDPGYAGTDSFTYVAHDGQGGSAAATCTITVENRLPVATDASHPASKNATTTVTLVASDDDGDALGYAVSPSSAQGGQVTVAGNVASYRAPDGLEGADSFTFTAHDGLGNSNTATVSLAVTNTVPVAHDGTASTHRDTPTTMALVATDGDGDPLTLTVDLLSAAGGTIATAGTVATYTPPAGFAGTDSFSFLANDGTADSALATVTVTVGDRLHVKLDAVGTGDGRSWADAFTDLQTALAAARPGDSIWIAAGTHRPSATGDRDAAFVLPPACRLYGGFAGTETALSQAAPATNVTTLSGDIGLPGDPSDNSRRIVLGSDGCHLEGLVLRDALGDVDHSDAMGAAFRLSSGSCTIARCSFLANRSVSCFGGPTVAIAGGDAVISDCSFLDNGSTADGDFAGALYAADGHLSLQRCSFARNASAWEGGDLRAWRLRGLDATDCAFSGSRSEYGGSWEVTLAFGATARVANCAFVGHDATAGGAVHLAGEIDMFGHPTADTTALFTNCVFASSTAVDGGAELKLGCNATLRNCTFYGRGAGSSVSLVSLEHPFMQVAVENGVFANCPTVLFDGEAAPTLSHSLVPGGHAGTGNLDGQALFADEADPDGPDGVLGTRDDGLRLLVRSPGVDGADATAATTTDLLGKNRAVGTGPDMGAYEAGSQVVFVLPSATGAGDGSSWADAFTELRDATAEANKGDEIWVAAGTYLPTAGTDPRTAFRPREGTTLHGGFAGTETRREEADPATNVSVLSGDIGTAGLATDNSQSIMIATVHMILDGFTFSGGYAQTGTAPAPSSAGGGLFMHNVSPLVRRCSFSGSSASWGGGVYGENSSARFEDCRFENNPDCQKGGGVYAMNPRLHFARCFFGGNAAVTGSAINCFSTSDDSSLTLEDCVFDGNVATGLGAVYTYGLRLDMADCRLLRNRNTGSVQRGGALFAHRAIDGSSMRDCLFEENEATGSGGAAYLSYSLCQVEDCRFTRNVAGSSGGAVFVYENSSVRFEGCTFEENGANRGGAAWCDFWTNASFAGCQFRGNTCSVSGGAIAAINVDLSYTLDVRRCSFVGNGGPEGAIFACRSSLTATWEDCLFAGNACTGTGHVTSSGSAALLFNHCTFHGQAGGAACFSIANSSSTVIGNSILWNEGVAEIGAAVNLGVHHSCVEGGWAGTGNVALDPLFVAPGDPDGPDELLATGDDGLRLGPLSPCLDGADATSSTTSDLVGTARPQGLGPDMGAYELW